MLTDYATAKGYDVLTTINSGEGFWVNAKTAFVVDLPTPTFVNSPIFADTLATGWSLIATGDSPTAAGFNSSLSIVPPSPGTVPINLTTLWAWDAKKAGWYFYAPVLDGGGTLSSYITSKGYIEFGNKVLDPTLGFWVNRQ